MIWEILYVICTIICYGIILYVNDLSFDDPIIICVIMCSLAWPILFAFYILHVLGHYVRLLLTKIIKTK